jgi:hypothetical protein
MSRARCIPTGARGFVSNATLTLTTEAREARAGARAILLG